jgi:hypothetical protein
LILAKRVKEAPIPIVCLCLLPPLFLFPSLLGLQLVLPLAETEIRVILSGTEAEQVAEAVLGGLGS